MKNSNDLMTKEKCRILLLYLLLYFKKICKNANIKYYAHEGTLLGAIRHKGFIPWDDDIDVVIFRKDYDLFIKSCNDILKRPVVVRTRENDPDFCAEYIKLCFIDDNIKFSEISLDVFILDDTNPKNKIKRYFQDIVIRWMYPIKLYRISKQSKHRYIPNNFVKRFILIVGGLIPSIMFEKIHKIMMQLEKSPCNYCVNWGSCYSYKKETFLKTDFGNGLESKFENLKIIIPSNSSKILCQLYGSDYMTPPPLDKRKDHGVGNLYCSALDMENVKQIVKRGYL